VPRQRGAGNAKQHAFSSPVRGRKKKRNTPVRRAGVEPTMLPHSEEVEMKNRVIVALLLAVVLALPAFAQQTTPTTQDQTPTKVSGAN